MSRGCDPHWLEAHGALPDLHERKSATYGTEDDRFANFTAVALITRQAIERYALERLVEKATRALNMIDAGQADAVAEYPDIASLGLVCEALRRKRINVRGLLPMDEPLTEERVA